jgi:hypothetical protein
MKFPEDAIQITGGRGETRPKTFTFPDGSYHTLRKLKTLKKSPQPPAPERKEDAELLQETINVAALPSSPVAEPEPKTEPLPRVEPEIEESEPMTAMKIAFRRIHTGGAGET